MHARRSLPLVPMVLSLAAACGDDFASGAPPASTDGGDDGGLPSLDGAVCDRSASPHDDPCANTERYSVYVSPTGADSNAGTKSAPMRTIGAALVSAKQQGKAHVVACDGAYDEHLTLSDTTAGISLHGGFHCTTWAFDPALRSLVAPTTPGPVVAVPQRSAELRIEDMAFSAAVAQERGASSIGLWVSQSQRVVLRRVTVATAAGRDGGVSGAGANHPGTVPPVGGSPTGLDGGPGASVTCGNGDTSSGGRGGYGDISGYAAGSGAAVPSAPASGARTGAGGDFGAATVYPGIAGADGQRRAAVSSLDRYGTLDATGWRGQAGTPGLAGTPGQGGGGGGGRGGGGGGSGGGSGGCGGAGGLGGAAGGSAFAVLAFESMVVLESADLTAGAGGAGGTGGTGQAGQAGSDGGSVPAASGGKGGMGGNGAGGGGGSGGSGGLSVGVAYVGTAPVVDASTRIVVGARGRAGTHGGGGAGGTNALSTGPTGYEATGPVKAGESAPILALK